MQLKTVKRRGRPRPWVRFVLLETRKGNLCLLWKECKTEVIADYKSGMTAKDIATKYDMKISNIIQNLKSAGVYKYVNRKWSNEDVAYLKEHYPYDSWGSLFEKFPWVTKETLQQKASSLGIKRAVFFWSKEDVETLKDAYSKHMPAKEIAALFNNRFTPEAIMTKAYKLNIKQRHIWSDDERNLLKSAYSTLPAEELLKLFPGEKLVNIQNIARSMGLRSYTYLSRKWEQKDDLFIINNWVHMSDYAMSESLNRTFRSVKWRREQLGLFREIPDGNYEYLRKYLWKTNRLWRKKSIIACKYRCVVTGGRFDDVHHLYASNLIVNETLQALGLEYNKVKDYSEYQLELISNEYAKRHDKYPLGVCLSHDIHTQFHNEYGYGDNTTEQFQDFLNKNYPTVQFPVTIKAA